MPSYEVPTSFREMPVTAVLDFVRTRALCTLVGLTPGGLYAGHLPVVLDESADGQVNLRGHVARSNAHWRALAGEALAGEAEAVAIFADQDAYAVAEPARAALAATRAQELFGAVHLYGRLRVFDDRNFARRNAEELTARHEAGRIHPWNTNDTPAETLVRLAAATLGVEFRVARAEACYAVDRVPAAEDSDIVIGHAARVRCPRPG